MQLSVPELVFGGPAHPGIPSTGSKNWEKGILKRRSRREIFLSALSEIFVNYVNKNAKKCFWGCLGRNTNYKMGIFSKFSRYIWQDHPKNTF